MIRLVGFTTRFLLTYSATSVSHIVDQDGDLVLDVTDKDHAAYNVGTRSLLVNKSKASVQAVSQRSSTLGATSVRGDNHAILNVEVLPDPTKDRGFRVEVIHGDIEEALNLRSMEVHGNDMVLYQC